MNKLLRYGCCGMLLVLIMVSCQSTRKLSQSYYPHFTHLPRFPDQASQQRYLDSLFFAAEINKQEGDFTRALFNLFVFLAYRPQDAAAHFEISRLFVQLQQPERALYYAEKAARIDTNNVWYQISYADLLVMNKRYDSAAAVFAGLYQHYPQHTEYLYNQAVLLSQSRFHREDSALKIFDTLEKINGLQEEYVYQKQRIYLEQHKIAAAAAEVRKLIAEYPDEPRYYRLLAQIFDQQQMHDSAIAVWEALLRKYPDYPQGLIAMALQFRRQGDTASFYRYMAKAFANPDLDIEDKLEFLYPFLQYVEVDSAQLQVALRLSRMVIAAHPDDSRAYALYGDIWLHAGQWNTAAWQDSADYAYRQAIALDTSEISWWQRLLRLYAMQQQTDSLYRLSHEVLSRFPGMPDGYYYCGMAQVWKHAESAAADTLQQALFLAGQDPEMKTQILSLLGTVYFDLQQYSRSDSCFEAALILAPDNDLILNNYSYYLAERGEHLQKALQMIQKAVHLQPDNYSYEDTYAWVLYKLKAYQAALQWMQKALAHPEAQQSPGYWVHYGDILFSLHRIDDAVSSWKMAVEKGDTSLILQQKIKYRTLNPDVH
ncbi:MAG: tetratricopeptide repeat protein [Thermoflavifilum aggregans]|nr:tetratricopeptide repeat protein [Thermoflavifilum aggregans]